MRKDVTTAGKIFKQQKVDNINTTNLYRQYSELAVNIKSNISNKPIINKNINSKNTENNIYITSWVKQNINGEIKHNNFGDDINFLFMPKLTGYKHKVYKKGKNITNYAFIGSIISDYFLDKHSIIWGSGILKNETHIRNIKPQKICAVRGPKTRDVLLKLGLDVPEIYGDPALLLPYYYYPFVHKKYKIGIIPHHTNINNEYITKFKDNNNILIINFKNYISFEQVIKDILSCDFILSESLHGLIISEAYKIPNIWISIKQINQNFKYEDFFLSINKPVYEPYCLTKDTTYDWLLSLRSKYNSTYKIDLEKLVSACPIPLKNLNLNNVIKRQNTNKVLLCCIAKMENNYIREFVEYYKNLGFDNICLYDNNDPDGERFETVIGDYIESGFVILKDVRGQKLKQIPSYTECYNHYKTKYDWIAFFDIDEFLHIDNGLNIKQFLSKDMYNNRGINCIRVTWKQFDDSEIIKPNGDYSIKKFKTYLPITKKDTCQTKVILKTVLPLLEFTSTHGPIKDNRLKCVNTAGNLCDNNIMIKNPTWENACLNHYRFRTIEEFVLNKMVRLWPTAYKGGGKKGLNLKMFFSYNKKTPEKVAYAEALLKKYNISRNE